ncbi:MAG: hypothetical protein U0736_23415 [Gemmataceae bacterium]
MDYEPEMIKQQMSETRSSLSEKLETLEQKVTDTIKETTESVNETVENVTSSVGETVDLMKETVGETVDKVKETFNLSGHIERYPWLAIGGAVAAGYALGMLVFPGGKESASSTSSASDTREGWLPSSAHAYDAPLAHAYESPPPRESGSMLGRLSSLAESAGLMPVVDQLKGFAIGAAATYAEKLIADALPDQFKDSVSELMTSVTHQLGGKVLDVPKDDSPRPPSPSPAAHRVS